MKQRGVLGFKAMVPMWRSTITAAAVLAACTLFSSSAMAQKSKERRPRGIITLAEVTITGRIQKPIAAVDVARIRPKLTLSELVQPFIHRISAAIYKSPF
jgi:hypothetical protein